MLRKVLVTTMASAFAIIVSMAANTPAYAAVPHHWMWTDGSDGGKVDFWPGGDLVRLCDTDGDGYRAVLNVRNWTKDRFEYEIEAIGDGNCTIVKASMGQPWNMAEGDCFQFHIFLYDAGFGHMKGDDSGHWRNDNNDKRWCG